MEGHQGPSSLPLCSLRHTSKPINGHNSKDSKHNEHPHESSLYELFTDSRNVLSNEIPTERALARSPRVLQISAHHRDVVLKACQEYV